MEPVTARMNKKLNVKGILDYLGRFSRYPDYSTVLRWIHGGKLPAEKIEGNWFAQEVDVQLRAQLYSAGGEAFLPIRGSNLGTC